MLFSRYASFLSVLLFSLISLATARPGVLDDSTSVWRRSGNDNTCPSGGNGAKTKCFELKYSQVYDQCSHDQRLSLSYFAPFLKFDFWVCFNEETKTLYIDKKVYTDYNSVGWLFDVIVSVSKTSHVDSCECSDPWTPPSWSKKGKQQCIPPPKECCPGYENCNGCCQPKYKDCPTYVKPRPHRRDLQVCKAGQSKCYTGSGSFDCIDTNADVESCGGCLFQSPQAKWNAAFVAGEDCTEIPHVSAVQCRQGRCVVEKCTASHRLDRATNSCVPLKMGTLKMQKYRLSDSS